LDLPLGIPGQSLRSGAASSSQVWIYGGSPTTFFLSKVSGGIFGDFYGSIAGNQLIDVIIMAALLLLGVAPILGVGSRISAYGGGLLVILLWSTQVPSTNNPFIDEHTIYLFLLFGLWRIKAGRTIGLGKWWSNTKIVKMFPWLE
jgi:thiosulfate dehydrogenase [quinone] large subunit